MAKNRPKPKKGPPLERPMFDLALSHLGRIPRCRNAEESSQVTAAVACWLAWWIAEQNELTLPEKVLAEAGIRGAETIHGLLADYEE